jgi:DNA-binding FadR family transcriptional regulator
MNAAERIYDTLARDGASAPLRSETLARRMEEDIASGPLQTGDSLGSVRALAERYGVGHSAVCEAIRILERRGLGRMRTGRGGGLVLSRPAMDPTAEELADFARLTGINRRQLLDAREAVDGATARLAAERKPGEAELARLMQIAASDEPPLARDLALRTELAQLAGNAAVRLFVQCLNSLTLDFARPAPPRDRSLWASALVSALAQGDGEAAARATCNSLDALSLWLVVSHGAAPVHGRTAADTDAQQNRSTEVARAILADLARLGDAGARLGSEWDLCERYGVGRLILRQAIRMLEDRGMVECRRGRGNGLLARSPQPYGAVRQAVAFLMAEDFEPGDIGELLCLLNLSAPALAVARADEAQRRRLIGMLERVETCDPIDRADYLELVRCVAELSDVPMIDIFCRCLVAYEARFRKNLPDTFGRGAQNPYLNHLRRLLAAGPLTGEALRQAKAETAAMMLDISRCRAP